MKVHPYAQIFPAIPADELDALAADIDAHGLREPITTYDGMILDGRNRFLACEKIGKKPRFEKFEGSGKDALDFVLSKNLHRRHLDSSQRAMVAAELATMKEGRQPNSANLPSYIPLVSQEKAAQALQVSTRAVTAAAAVKDGGIPELQEAVKAGEVSVSAAAELATLPAPQQRVAVKGGKKAVSAAVKKVKEKKAAKKAEAEKPAPQPGKPYTKDDGVPDLPGVYRPRFMRNNDGHEVCLDFHDNPMPDKVGDIFADSELRELLAESIAASEAFDELHKRVMKMKRKPTFPWVDIPKIQDTTGAIRDTVIEFTDHLREAVPHLVCPECSGSGCKKCMTVGYIPKVVYDTHPEYQRRKRAG